MTLLLVCIVEDADGDEVRCRWAKNTNGSIFGECGDVCEAFIGAVLNEVRTYVFKHLTIRV